MKIPVIAFLVLVLSALAGAVGGWFFTMDTVVPWLHVAPEWSNLTGLLLFLFFFLEVGAAVGFILGCIGCAIVACILYIVGSALSKLSGRRT